MISCSNYDYVEIACMYKYTLVLTLRNGEQVKGTAIDTARNPERQECLLLRLDNRDELVVLNHIQTLTVTTPNAQFTQVTF